MRCILILTLVFFCGRGYAQWKDYKLNAKGDTLNRIDMQGKKQGPWLNHIDELRGEPGYEEEGYYKDDRKEGEWRLYSLSGDIVGLEGYRWGFKDGICQYFTMHGDLRLEQSWKALNPDQLYDTLDIEDPDKLDTYTRVVVKNEGVALKHGTWKYFDPSTGSILRTETYTLGKLESGGENRSASVETTEKKSVAKPKEVLEFEKKNAGKKKVKYKDGSVGF